MILAGALLFTNAVEWLGHRLSLGEGAVGSVLAAVGTAMPETLIPIVAIIGGSEGSEDVAIGAIIGAPFLLATLAMALVGALRLPLPRRREQGLELDGRHPDARPRPGLLPRLLRGRPCCSAWRLPTALRIPLAVVFVGAYVVYVRRTPARRRRGPGGGDDRPPLHGPPRDARRAARPS